MNSKFQALALAGSAVLAMGFAATSAQAANTNAQAKAKVLKQLTITKTSDLDFGTVVSGPAAGNVTVSKAGNRTCGLTCTGTVTAAGFKVTGSNNNTFTVSLPDKVSLVRVGGTETMEVDLDAQAPLQFGNSGSGGVEFNIGGVLSVGIDQVEGDYQIPTAAGGGFKVEVAYQ